MHVHREEQAWKLSLSLSFSLNNLLQNIPSLMARLSQLLRSQRGTAKIFLNRSILGRWHVFSITKDYKKPHGSDAKASAGPSALCNSGWKWKMNPSRVFGFHLKPHHPLPPSSSPPSSIFSCVVSVLPSWQQNACAHVCVDLDAPVLQYVSWFGSDCGSEPGSFFYWQSGHHGYMPCCDLSGSTYHVLSGWYTLSAEDMA